MTTTAPAHVALVDEFTHAAFEFGVSHAKGKPRHPAESKRLKDAGVAIYTALAQPALAAPVPQAIDIDALADEILRIDGYGAMSPSELAEGLMPFILRRKAQQPTPAASPKQGDIKGAHIWIRHALGVLETAPYRFDFYAQEIEALKLAQVMQPVEASQSELRAALEMLYADTADYITLNNLSAMNNGSMVRARKALGISVEVIAPVAPTREQIHFTRDDELSLLLDMTREMALGDKSLHAATQWVEALGGVQYRLAALSAAQPQVLSDAGRKAYTHMTDNHPTIHSNRFPGWNELDDAERTKWNARANLKLQAGGEEA